MLLYFCLFFGLISGLYSSPIYRASETKVLPHQPPAADNVGDYKYFINRNESWVWTNKYVMDSQLPARPLWIDMDRTRDETPSDYQVETSTDLPTKLWLKKRNVVSREVDVGVEQKDFVVTNYVPDGDVVIDEIDEVWTTEEVLIENWTENGWTSDELPESEVPKVEKWSKRAVIFTNHLDGKAEEDSEEWPDNETKQMTWPPSDDSKMGDIEPVDDCEKKCHTTPIIDTLVFEYATEDPTKESSDKDGTAFSERDYPISSVVPDIAVEFTNLLEGQPEENSEEFPESESKQMTWPPSDDSKMWEIEPVDDRENKLHSTPSMDIAEAEFGESSDIDGPAFSVGEYPTSSVAADTAAMFINNNLDGISDQESPENEVKLMTWPPVEPPESVTENSDVELNEQSPINTPDWQISASTSSTITVDTDEQIKDQLGDSPSQPQSEVTEAEINFTSTFTTATSFDFLVDSGVVEEKTISPEPHLTSTPTWRADDPSTTSEATATFNNQSSDLENSTEHSETTIGPVLIPSSGNIQSQEEIPIIITREATATLTVQSQTEESPDNVTVTATEHISIPSRGTLLFHEMVYLFSIITWTSTILIVI